jgi:hypothetical protein
MKPFKFFQKKERVFSEYMDRMDDYFLGGITVNEHFPEYYHSVGFEFVGVSQIMFDTDSLSSYKVMMFRCRNTGVVVQGDLIDNNHPMWDYNSI